MDSEMIARYAAFALTVMHDIAGDEDAPPAVRLDAAKQLVDIKQMHEAIRQSIAMEQQLAHQRVPNGVR